MRKIALSIAAIAVLFVAGAQAGSQSWSNGNTRMSSNQGDNIRAQDRPDWELGVTPILGHHLQQAAMQQSIGADTDAEKESWATRKDADCNIRLTTPMDKKLAGPFGTACASSKSFEADCQTNDWGCNNKFKYVNTPAASTVVGVENVLMATVVPAQILTSTQNTVTAANQCQASAAERKKAENECFEVSGNFVRSKFDVQEQSVSEASCFLNSGKGNACYEAKEGMHPVNACDAHCISSQDMLDMDQKCDCMIFENPRHHRMAQINDPEDDVEYRINKQIDKTIADVLTEIVQNVFNQAFEGVIDFSN